MKYVLIIGAKSELGIELASLYAKNNYNLYLAGRSIEKIRPQSEILEKQNNNKVTLCELDVTDINSHKDFYNSLKIKPIGIVYVAGYCPDQNKALLNFMSVIFTFYNSLER